MTPAGAINHVLPDEPGPPEAPFIFLVFQRRGGPGPPSSVRVCACVCVCVFIYACVHVWVCAFLCAHVYMCVHGYAHVFHRGKLITSNYKRPLTRQLHQLDLYLPKYLNAHKDRRAVGPGPLLSRLSL